MESVLRRSRVRDHNTPSADIQRQREGDSHLQCRRPDRFGRRCGRRGAQARRNFRGAEGRGRSHPDRVVRQPFLACL